MRGTELDGTFICLLLERSHMQYAVEAHCDGFYSYFASPISWGSTPSNWAQAAGFAKSHSLIFAPSVGPGYVDTRVRPWNGAATRERSRSRYYDQAWGSALGAVSAGAEWVSITSFNEWHEGTQIEPAKEGMRDGAENFKYEAYSGGPEMYLEATRRWVDKMAGPGG